MFETSVREEPASMDWGIVSGCIAFILLLVIGYMLVA